MEPRTPNHINWPYGKEIKYKCFHCENEFDLSEVSEIYINGHPEWFCHNCLSESINYKANITDEDFITTEY